MHGGDRAMMRALVFEDEPEVRELVAEALGHEGFDVRAEPGGSDAEQVVATFRPDIVLLDIGLGEGPNGFEVARRLRSASDVPMVFVSGAHGIRERLAGFAAGGDDYLTKPFAVEELLARVRAIMQRSGRAPRRVWRVGDMVVDEDAHTVAVGDSLVDLTSIEFALLVTLCRNPGRVMAKIQLLNEVWGFDQYSLNLVEVHVSALRRKLEAHGPRMIHTIRNVGYVLRP
ncbi:MAG TPA: response regulator transcription factor [Acidimicrobiales bacterium]|jgi:two-component system, OmpR family, response regulator|nr:response regulator transcription factor [Acidimicrobiales bacterium]